MTDLVDEGGAIPTWVPPPEMLKSIPCFPTGHALLVGMPLTEIYYSHELDRWCYDIRPVAPDEVHIPFGTFDLNT